MPSTSSVMSKQRAATVVQRWWRKIDNDKVAFLKKYINDYAAWEAGEIDDYGNPIPDDEDE